MNPRDSNITIEDVAAEAAVSVATVSRALRGLPNVAPSTRQRVLEAAERLDYRPDPNASRLARGRSGALAVAIPMLNGWYFSQVVAGIEAVVKESGYDLLVHGIGDEEARQRFVSGRTPLGNRVDGMVMVDLRVNPEDAEALAKAGVVASTVGFRTPQFPSVTLDDIGVARLAVEYLLDIGHRRIGIIAGIPDDALRFVVPDRRRIGYQDALLAAGIEPDPELEAAGDFSVEGGAEAMVSLMKLEQPPSAVFAMSDEMAFGAIQTARAMELSVPDDVSVIGVDDHDLSAVMDLTTIRQRVIENGAVAARLLLNTLQDSSEPPVHHSVEFELVVRGTTGRI
jgi:DNA-binding LacI/PurR family transcriptional regulator